MSRAVASRFGVPYAAHTTDTNAMYRYLNSRGGGAFIQATTGQAGGKHKAVHTKSEIQSLARLVGQAGGWAEMFEVYFSPEDSSETLVIGPLPVAEEVLPRLGYKIARRGFQGGHQEYYIEASKR